MLKFTIAIVVLILLSAYFSATETAFTSLNKLRIKKQASNGDMQAKLVLKLVENYGNVLTTVLIGNNIVNITMTSIATVLFVKLYGTYGPTVSTVVITLAVLIFGEITPKSLAKDNPEKFSMFAAPLLNFFVIIFKPITALFIYWKQFTMRLFRTSADSGITDDELITMVEEAETEGTIDEERSELIQNAIEFNELEAYDVLTPRVDVEAVEVDEDRAEIAKLFLETGFSRLPVYEENMDKIIGVLHQKDFHNFILGENHDLRDYIMPVVFTPGSVKIAQLLKRLKNAKSHIAIVIDEYGGTEGIVTMEDIIEELVGEIFDEHDLTISKDILQIYDGSYRVQGATSVEKMFDFFNVKEEELSISTVNGWVGVHLDKLPQVGDSFEYENLFVKVMKSDGKKAIEINVRVLDKSEDKEDTK
jgi:hypothetical protein